MGFIERRYRVGRAIRATRFLQDLGYDKRLSQKILDKGRMFRLLESKNYVVVKKGEILESCEIILIEFIAQDLGISPIFDGEFCLRDSKKINFCIFKKPAKLLTHPKNLSKNKSMLDSLRHHCGKNANACHRLDRETSGLLLCAKDKKSESFLKNLFSQNCVHKEYLSVLEGRLERAICIESNIDFPKNFGNLCVRGEASEIKISPLNLVNLSQHKNTKKAITLIIPLQNISNLNNFLESNEIFADCIESKENGVSNFIDYYNEQIIINYENFKDSIMKQNRAQSYTFAKLIPITGKTHQLRIHTSALKHAIVGDIMYGRSDSVASFFLDIGQFSDDKFVESKQKDSIKLQNLDFTSQNELNLLDNFRFFHLFLKDKRDEIENLARLYFCGNKRLLLHSNRLKFLHYDFMDFRV